MKLKHVWPALLAVVLLTPACKKESAPGPDVWAVVNGREIQREEVEKLYRTTLDPDRPQPSAEEVLTLKLNILEELINSEILLERARAQNLEATDGEVEDKITEMKAPYTEEEFQRQLKAQDLTLEDLRDQLRRQLSGQKVINREVNSKVSITEQEVAEAYEQNRQLYNLPEPRYRMAQIVVTPRPDPGLRNRRGDDAATDPEARRKAAGLLERIQAGADFAELARDYSEDPTTAASGGEMGFFFQSALNQADPQTRRVVQELRPGETSGVIFAGGAYRILRLISREPAGQRTLEDPRVQGEIREALRNRKEQLLRTAFFTVARNQAQVTNYLARQVLETNGKLPSAVTAPAAAEQPEGSSAPAKSAPAKEQ